MPVVEPTTVRKPKIKEFPLLIAYIMSDYLTHPERTDIFQVKYRQDNSLTVKGDHPEDFHALMLALIEDRVFDDANELYRHQQHELEEYYAMLKNQFTLPGVAEGYLDYRIQYWPDTVLGIKVRYDQEGNHPPLYRRDIYLSLYEA